MRLLNSLILTMTLSLATTLAFATLSNTANKKTPCHQLTLKTSTGSIIHSCVLPKDSQKLNGIKKGDKLELVEDNRYEKSFPIDK